MSWSLGNNFEVGRFLQIQPITPYTYGIKVQVATHSPGGKQECAKPRAPNPLNPRLKASFTSPPPSWGLPPPPVKEEGWAPKEGRGDGLAEPEV